MSSSLIVIIVPVLVAVFVFFLVRHTAKVFHQDQLTSWARQDEVAAAALLAAQDAARQAENSSRKLDRIHTLVNSDMTAARQGELDQTRAMAAIQERVVRATTAAAGKPDPVDVQALQRTRARIAELEAILADRLAQFREVEIEESRRPIAE